MFDELKYQIMIYWDFDKKVFVAEVPELDGCQATGDDYGAALNKVLKEMKKWSNRAFASSVITPQPVGKLPLRDDLYCVNCRQRLFTSSKWKRSKE